MVDINENDTLYAIVAKMSENMEQITVGKLGIFSFPKGIYVYVGSAKRNIKARIERHLRKEKNFHWHFDYLRPYTEIVRIKTFPGDVGECGLFAQLRAEYGGEIIVPKFGSSDCSCPAHLFYISGNKRIPRL